MREFTLPRLISSFSKIPLWFQAISALSARDSGYRLVPLLTSCVVATILSSFLTGKLHYYQPFMILGAIILSIGCGLLTRLGPFQGVGIWIVGEILTGFGTGLGSPLCYLAVHDALPHEDAPIGFSVLLTIGNLGASIALASAQAIFASTLDQSTISQHTSITPDTIFRVGATDLRALIPASFYKEGIQILSHSLTRSWFVSVGLASVSILAALGFKWKKLDMNDDK